GPVQWICDRYEVRQQGSFREDAAFDSLRNTYPVAALRGLAKVHGSKIIFMMDPATAKPASVQTRPGSTVAPTTSDRLSSTAQKCLVSGSNAERMLNDMGTLYFPDGPKRVGETWTLTHRTNHKSFGTTITKLDCTLRSVRDVDGSQIATIDLHGQIKMATAPGLSAPPASAAEKGTDQKAQVANVTATTHPTTHPTTQPTTAPVSKTRGRQVARDKPPPRTTPARLAKKDEKRRLERAVCTGSVEFDLTHGEVVRMNIHREIALVKTLSGGKSDKTPVQANQTQAHTFRVRRYQSRPRYPIIQGGPKPPPEPVKKASPAKPFRRRPTTRVADAKRRAAKGRNRRSEKLTDKPTAKRQPLRKNPNRTARKGANKRRTPTSQPRDPRSQRPTSRPAGAKRPRTINRPTSQPAKVPTTRPA
ncbi:MAG: hypothetical protein O7B26_09320, partial [Planctomycetota bacterium]|nr:hypothetical protein [Planctomycetota bacterium]